LFMRNEIIKQDPRPVFTTHLFPELLTGLLNLLTTLSGEDWTKPIPRKAWSVKDVALHLLGVDVGVLSRERDRHVALSKEIRSDRELVEFVKTLNDEWIHAAQRLSPRLLCDLLRVTGAQLNDYFQSLDPYVLGGPIGWAGLNRAPNWLRIAREFTERWHHQQHIREAVARPGYVETRYLKPTLDTFMRALPHTYRSVEAREGTIIDVTIAGNSGDRWLLVREPHTWSLYLGSGVHANAAVAIPQEIAWKLFTKWITKEEALKVSDVRGDSSLALRVFDMTAVIA
jgi:uncharacterized protein (TIGR03083 family)